MKRNELHKSLIIALRKGTQSKYEKSNNDLDELNNNLNQKSAELIDLCAEIEKLEKDIDQFSGELPMQIKENEAAISSLRAKNIFLGINKEKNKLEEIKRIKSLEIDQKKQEVEQLRTIKNQIEEALDVAKQKAQNAFFLKKAKEATVEKIKNELEVATRNWQSADQSLSDLCVACKAEIDAQSNYVEELQDRAKKNTAQITINESNIISLRGSLERLKKQLEAKQTKKTLLEREIKSEKRKISQLKKELADIYVVLSDNNKKILALENELSKVNQTIENDAYEAKKDTGKLINIDSGSAQQMDNKRELLVENSNKLKKSADNGAVRLKGTEPIKIRQRMINLFNKLDEAYPDGIVFGLHRDHKKWGETVTELYRALGYESSTAFLNAYGYTIKTADPKAPLGRPKTVFAEDIIVELQRRYPNGSEFTSVVDLFAANTDLASKKKALANTAQEYFGMPLGKYLKYIGILRTNVSAEKEDVDYAFLLENFATIVKGKLSGRDYIPDSVEKLSKIFPDIDCSGAKKWIRHIYNDKSLDQFLQEKGILNATHNEAEEMQVCIDILKERYKDKPSLPTMLSELYAENSDLPIRNINKYIRDVLGESNTEKYYIKNKIFQGKPTDLQEYTYCSIFIEERNAVFYYRSKQKNISVGDYVVVDFGGYEATGKVKEVQQCLGIDAPWPVESTKTIIRVEKTRKINVTNITTNSQSENNNIKDMNIKNNNLNEIFEIKKIEKVPQKAEYLHCGESFSNPMDGERGFFGTVFRGLEKDIQRAKKICNRPWIYGDIEKTDLEGVFQFSVQYGAEEEIREILKTIPALKMVTFYVWWGGSCAVCYSHSGYPYITKFPNSLSMILHVPEVDDEPWIYRRSADEKGFFERVDYSGTMGMIHYAFPEEKDWNAINYITEIDGSLYKLTGYVGAKAELEATFSTDVKKIETNVSGKSFVLTGFGAKDEKKITDEIVSRGGVIKSSVSTKTDFVIFLSEYGQETSKLSKAKELNATGKNITILNEKQLTEFFRGVVQTQEVPADNSADVEVELAKIGFVVKNGLLKKYKGKDAEIVIPEIVTSISKNAFANNQTLRKVTFGKNVKKIGESAFESCPVLEEVSLNEGLTHIGVCAFRFCNNLKNITLPHSVSSIGGSSFRATAIESVKIPDKVTELDNWTFAECKQLKEVKMSQNIYRLYDIVFYKCEQLKEIEFPPSLRDIGEDTFQNCVSLEKVVFPEKAHFNHTKMEYDDGFYEVPKSLFYGCNKLVIYTTKGSCADEYAKKENLKVVYL